jgi:predicted DNA binding protein
MRRLTVECSTDEFARVIGDPTLQKIESLEVISFLRHTEEGAALIFRVKFKGEVVNVEEMFSGDGVESQLLDQEEDGTCTFFVKRGHTSLSRIPLAAGGYVSTPHEIRDGKVRTTFVGDAKQIRRIREAIEEKGVKHRVVSLTDALFPPGSPLGRLTEKQQRVLILAYRQGYYDTPKRISSKELARRLKVKPSTAVVRRRRAERRLLAELIGP